MILDSPSESLPDPPGQTVPPPPAPAPIRRPHGLPRPPVEAALPPPSHQPEHPPELVTEGVASEQVDQEVGRGIQHLGVMESAPFLFKRLRQ